MGEYLRFGQMLLDGDITSGKRVLSPKTVRAMTSDHLGANIKNNVAAVASRRLRLRRCRALGDDLAATPDTVGDYT